MKIIFLLLTLVSLTLVQASEMDSFTLRFPTPRDATERVDQLTRELVLKAIDQANDQGSCEPLALYTSIRKSLGGGPLWSELEKILAADDLIDRRLTTRKESIYRALSFFDSFPLFVADMGTNIQIGDHVVGTDKFGHFFENGWRQFEKAYLQERGLEEGLEMGEAAERGIEGWKITGIYSHGDLVANFKGMMFYRQLTDSFLESGETPYVVCQENKWVLQHLPSWKEMIDAGLDEAVNCNSYVNANFEVKVKSKIMELEKKYQRRTQCPISPNLCLELVEKYRKNYPQFHERLLSPECLSLRGGDLGP